MLAAAVRIAMNAGTQWQPPPVDQLDDVFTQYTTVTSSPGDSVDVFSGLLAAADAGRPPMVGVVHNAGLGWAPYSRSLTWDGCRTAGLYPGMGAVQWVCTLGWVPYSRFGFRRVWATQVQLLAQATCFASHFMLPLLRLIDTQGNVSLHTCRYTARFVRMSCESACKGP